VLSWADPLWAGSEPTRSRRLPRGENAPRPRAPRTGSVPSAEATEQAPWPWHRVLLMLGPRRATAAPQHPAGWDPCTGASPAWGGSSPGVPRGGGEAWGSRGAGGRGQAWAPPWQAALAPRTHSWAPAAGPGRAVCTGIFGKRNGRGGR